MTHTMIQNAAYLACSLKTAKDADNNLKITTGTAPTYNQCDPWNFSENKKDDYINSSSSFIYPAAIVGRVSDPSDNEYFLEIIPLLSLCCFLLKRIFSKNKL